MSYIFMSVHEVEKKNISLISLSREVLTNKAETRLLIMKIVTNLLIQVK